MELGWPALAVDLAGASGGGVDRYRAYAREVAGQLTGRSILVAHSGAGALIPAIAQAGEGRVVGAIYVDALLPHPGRSWFDTAPSFLADAIRDGAKDGRAPPWSALVPEPLLADMLPDAVSRDSFARSCPSVAMDYLQEVAPRISQRSIDGLSAYLQLSAGYDDEATTARARRWRVKRIEGHHLSIITAATDVAGAIADLATRMAAAS
jgi:hypothetical protein